MLCVGGRANRPGLRGPGQHPCRRGGGRRAGGHVRGGWRPVPGAARRLSRGGRCRGWRPARPAVGGAPYRAGARRVRRGQRPLDRPPRGRPRRPGRRARPAARAHAPLPAAAHAGRAHRPGHAAGRRAPRAPGAPRLGPGDRRKPALPPDVARRGRARAGAPSVGDPRPLPDGWDAAWQDRLAGVDGRREPGGADRRTGVDRPEGAGLPPRRRAQGRRRRWHRSSGSGGRP